jgi:hypothetical protein
MSKYVVGQELEFVVDYGDYKVGDKVVVEREDVVGVWYRGSKGEGYCLYHRVKPVGNTKTLIQEDRSSWKAGDTLELLEDYMGFKKGHQFKVRYFDKDLPRDNCIVHGYDCTSEEPILVYTYRCKKVPAPSSSETQWTFNVNAEYQIDFEAISRELTKEHPVAVVTIPGKTFGVVSKKLVDKWVHAQPSRKRRSLLSTWCRNSRKMNSSNRASLFIIKEGQLPNFYKFWKEVKTCTIDSCYRGKREVKVTLSKI